jgi:uncharacterized membrane protein
MSSHSIRGRLSVTLLTIHCAALASAACLAADLESANPLSIELLVFRKEIAAQCSSVQGQLKEFKVKADPLTGYNLKDAVQSLCVCMPAKTESWVSTLSDADLERPVTEMEFLNFLHTAVIDKCAAEQMQSMYGDQCRKRFKTAGLNVSKYCSCMKNVVSGYSDAMTAEIAAAASDYLPLAADAEKSGEPAPPRPPVLDTYYQADQGCKATK